MGIVKHRADDILRMVLETFNNAPNRWWWVFDGKEESMILDRDCFWLWQKDFANTACSLQQSKSPISQIKISGLDSWQLPEASYLVNVVQNQFPLREGPNYRIRNVQECFLTTAGGLNLDDLKGHKEWPGCVLVTRPFPTQNNAKAVIDECLQRGWSLRSHTGKHLTADLMQQLRGDYQRAKSFLSGNQKCLTASFLKQAFKKIDSQSVKLPELEPSQITDPAKGLWELHGDGFSEKERISLEIDELLRGRDPNLDVQKGFVTIDFGTSSTVVAYRENGQDRLLRIGVHDYWAPAEAKHYENPTVLEFIDFQRFLLPWQSMAYRPLTQWTDVKASHEALNHLRDNQGDVRIVGSVLLRLKQWALRSEQDLQVSFTDQSKGYEYRIDPLTLRPPSKGTPIIVSQNDLFDPVEVYAYYLGMVINWRQRGIFTRYYMTFPVAYPQTVKEKILASFHRGLQRSLPQSITTNTEVLKRFSVEERASEPAAYAIAALDTLKITPTEEGHAYGVFDFGGGTTDFDFGIYRLADEEEAEEGYEAVIEHFGASGDKFLGGENILENMAYLVFKEPRNLEICRRHQISFQKPIDAEDFPGSELFLEKTQAAITNMVMLVSRLRKFWEGAELSDEGPIAIELLSREGLRKNCELILPRARIRHYLETRLEMGVRNFYTSLKTAFLATPYRPRKVHVLLAGNGSRSPFITEIFGKKSSPIKPVVKNTEDLRRETLEERINAFLEQLLDDFPMGFEVHLPLQIDKENFYKPTAKTGVALGLLRLCPGEPIKIVNYSKTECEAPFQFFVGYLKLRKFEPMIRQGGEYGKWEELGVPRDGIFNLFYTASPQALTGELTQGDRELAAIQLEFTGIIKGKRVFVRAVSPTEIESCLATVGTVEIPGQQTFLQRHDLQNR